MTDCIRQAFGSGEVQSACGAGIHTDIDQLSVDAHRLTSCEGRQCRTQPTVERYRGEARGERRSLPTYFEEGFAGVDSGVGGVLADEFERLIDPLYDEQIEFEPNLRRGAL